MAVLPFRLGGRRSDAGPSGPPKRGLLLLTVTLGGGVAPVLMLLALDRTTSGTVSLLLNLELVATVLIAGLFLHEHIGRRTTLGMVGVLAGGVVVTGFGGTHLTASALLVAGACLCWGIDNAITASLDRYSPTMITLAKGLVAGTVNIALGIGLEHVPSVRTIVAALAIGSFGYGLSITLWIAGARLIGAARGQAIFALAPFVGAILAWPILGESLRGRMLVSFAISLAGVMVVVASHHLHVHAHPGVVHAHNVDPTDIHHQRNAIEMLGAQSHRHLVLVHEHHHLPDIHHRHEHSEHVQ